MNEALEANNAIVVGTYWWKEPFGFYSTLDAVDEVYTGFGWSEDMIRFTDLDGSLRDAIQLFNGFMTPNEFVIDTKTMAIYDSESLAVHYMDLLAVTAELNK